MDDKGFRRWLETMGDAPNTVNTRLATVRRIEVAYGDLESAHNEDQFETILGELIYSALDFRRNEPNPSRLAIEGDLYKGLASCRTHLKKYSQFLDLKKSVDVPDVEVEIMSEHESDAVADALTATFGLEADLQKALRTNLAQLEPGLRIDDGGTEAKVASGFIDILARDEQNRIVVIELKAVAARRDAVSQILSYMGDLMENGDCDVRGILIAPDFDAKSMAAARAVPSLNLIRYGFNFTFTRT